MRLTTSLLAAAGLLIPALAHAQTTTWVPLVPGVPAGTPATLELDQAASSHQRTVLDLRVFGFWRTDIVGADGQGYARLDFPGLGEIGQIGAPELPALRPCLAVVTDATDVALLAGGPTLLGEQTFALNVYPTPQPGLDDEVDPSADPGEGDPNGSPEKFEKDADVYGLIGAWPSTAATELAKIAPHFGSIPCGSVELFPARFDPSKNELTVAAHMRVAYLHTGALQTFAPITQDKAVLAAAAFPNWPTASQWISSNHANYEGRYLIVTPEEHLDELADFIAYRKATGYLVTVKTLEELEFVSCGNVRGMIQAWYAAGLPQFDHYCLLVGDADVIPMCPSPNVSQILGDDLYGSPSGSGDLEEEVYVGRLSVDDGADLSHQIEKIIGYETDPSFTHDYRRALLVAHEEDAPGKYVGAHEAVANAPYAVPPVFLKAYGHLAGVDNFDVTTAIESGVGLVAYRGHGSTNTWSSWNLAGEAWHKNDVVVLNNGMLPVVWSFSCTNQNIDGSTGTTDCIGENWLEAERGAVAHYGAQIASGTSKNHVLDAAMFEAVYDKGITTHAQAIAFAEDAMKAALPTSGWQNEWMYFLLGDPAMKIRRNGPPLHFDLVLPKTVPTCDGSASCTFTAQVIDPATGGPVSGVLVSAFKPGFDGKDDEVLVNAYSDANGLVVLPSPASLGSMAVSVRDAEGNVKLASVSAQAGAFTDLGDALAGAHGEPRLESSSSLLPGSKLVLSIENGMPSGLGALAVGPVDAPTALFGGILHPIPWTGLVPVTLDAEGEWTLVLSPWPGYPAGSELVLQAAILDAGAPQGFAFSNALHAVTP